MRTRCFPFFLCTLFVSPILSGCGGAEGAPSATDIVNERAPLPVQAAVLGTGAFTDSITLFGRVEAKERVRVTAEMPGRIEGLPFSEGQNVGRGQTLARINARLASAQVDQAAAAAALAEANLKRTQALHAKKLASGADLDVATAQAAQSKAALEIARANLDKAVIRSPIEGQVTHVTGKVGELASPGIPLLEVVSIQSVEVQTDVPESDVSLLEIGSPVRVELEAYAGRRFEGTILEVGLVANPTTRTFPVKVQLENDERLLRPGMLARVTLVRQQYQDVVLVPRDAILDEVDGKSVYVVQGDKAQRRPVRLGPTRGRLAMVREGLRAGDKLIVLGHRQVVDGQAVTVSKQSNCCAPEAGSEPTEGTTDSAAAASTLPQKG